MKNLHLDLTSGAPPSPDIGCFSKRGNPCDGLGPAASLSRVPLVSLPLLMGLVGAVFAVISTLFMPFASSPFVWGTSYSYISFSHTRACSVVVLGIAGGISLAAGGHLISTLAGSIIVGLAGFDLYRNVLSVSRGSLQVEPGGIIIMMGGVLLLAASLCAGLPSRRFARRA